MIAPLSLSLANNPIAASPSFLFVRVGKLLSVRFTCIKFDFAHQCFLVNFLGYPSWHEGLNSIALRISFSHLTGYGGNLPRWRPDLLFARTCMRVKNIYYLFFPQLIVMPWGLEAHGPAMEKVLSLEETIRW